MTGNLCPGRTKHLTTWLTIECPTFEDIIDIIIWIFTKIRGMKSGFSLYCINNLHHVFLHDCTLTLNCTLTLTVFIYRKYCVLDEHEFSREHHQQVNTYSMHTNYRVRNSVGTSPVRISKQLILMSHVGLMIHWCVIKNYVFLQKCKVNNKK